MRWFQRDVSGDIIPELCPAIVCGILIDYSLMANPTYGNAMRRTVSGFIRSIQYDRDAAKIVRFGSAGLDADASGLSFHEAVSFRPEMVTMDEGLTSQVIGQFAHRLYEEEVSLRDSGISVLGSFLIAIALDEAIASTPTDPVPVFFCAYRSLGTINEFMQTCLRYVTALLDDSVVR